MPHTRSMAKKDSYAELQALSTELQVPSIAVPRISPHQAFTGKLFAGLLVEVDSDTAKKNLVRLWYGEETRPFITTELYNDVEDLRFRTDIKIAACYVLSQPSCRHGILPTIADLSRMLHQILRDREIPMDNPYCLRPDQLHDLQTSLKIRFDDLIGSQNLRTLPSEDLFQQLAKRFIDGYSSGDVPACPLTRVQADTHLSNSYGNEYTKFDWSCHARALMTACLNFSYDGLHA